ncbi:tetratricopeptide repeat protein [Hanstruepera marina]|uniref:tetratricopeptide repeat protein n=1 Tax=Hanstruepera marina TaxID=2873265 RepID=UPI001CA6078F|nr:tetratricopeptide repeat protein [Hanstruepera marina]
MKKTILLFLVCNCLFCHAQEKQVDSLMLLINQTNSSLQKAELSAQLGRVYVMQNNLDSAKVYYSQARNIYRKTDSLFAYTQNTMRLGNINLAQNNHIEALKIYQECLSVSNENNFKSLIPHLYNNIGLVYKQIEDFDDAKNNFQEAYKLFLENNDEPNSVYPLYNIALIESIVGNDEDAINRYLNLTTYHLKTENWVSLASVYNSISEIYLKNEDYNRAKEYLEMALNAIEDKRDSFNTGPSSFYEASIYTNAAELYFKEGEIDLAKKYASKGIKLSKENSYKLNIFKSAKILAEIYDNENEVDSSLLYYKIYIDFNNQYQDEYDVKQLTKLKMQNEFDEILRQNEIDRIYQEAEYKNRELRYIGVAGFSVLLAVILILLYINQKNKNAKLKLKEENLLLEKKKLNQDLEYKKKELASNMMFLMEKNEFITSISKKLIELKPDAKKDNKDLIQQIINEIRQNSSTKMWEEFEIRFKEVHKDFYNELHKTHPDLTLNEVKICAFLRLNMSSKEISAITHQSVKSINMARFRLRKKLHIDRDENLIAYLKSLE